VGVYICSCRRVAAASGHGVSRARRGPGSIPCSLRGDSNITSHASCISSGIICASIGGRQRDRFGPSRHEARWLRKGVHLTPFHWSCSYHGRTCTGGKEHRCHESLSHSQYRLFKLWPRPRLRSRQGSGPRRYWMQLGTSGILTIFVKNQCHIIGTAVLSKPKEDRSTENGVPSSG